MTLCSTISDRLNLKNISHNCISSIFYFLWFLYYNFYLNILITYLNSSRPSEGTNFFRHLARTLDVRLPHETIPCPHRATQTQNRHGGQHISMSQAELELPSKFFKYSEVFHSVHYHIIKNTSIIPPKYTMFIY